MNQILDNIRSNEQSSVEVKRFFAKVYGFMFGALLISGLIAWQYGTPEFVLEHFYKLDPSQTKVTPTILWYVVLFAPVGIALLMQSMVRRLSLPVLVLLFAAYSILLGFGLSTIFLVYSIGSIVAVFFATAGSFGIMAIMGFITPLDLTKFGSLLYMVFIGMFFASIVNVFLGSDTMGYIIAFLGVFVFTGLTAYHMQKLKEFAQSPEYSEEERGKMALIGGFTLYVLFINLFLSLLRLFGSRD